MKLLTIIAAFTLSTTLASAKGLDANKDQWTCDSESFPMAFEAKIYKEGDRYFGQLYQIEESEKTYEDNDGDTKHETLRVADDMVELKLVINNERGLTFQQTGTAKEAAKAYSTNVKPSGKSEGVQIFVTAKKDSQGRQAGKIKADKGPFGERIRDTVGCW